MSTDDVVLTASASDADSGSNGKVRLEVVSGNEAGFFSLNGDTGQMQLVKSLDLDAANSPPRNFTLVIKATDCGQPVLDANATFHLKVGDRQQYNNEITTVYHSAAVNVCYIIYLNTHTYQTHKHIYRSITRSSIIAIVIVIGILILIIIRKT